MEAMYFAVGVLTMVLLAIASLAVYSTVMVLKLKNRLEEQIRSVYDEVNHIHRSINDNRIDVHSRIDELQSYTDRRFDKMIDTYLLVKETEKESKKLIKG